MLGPCRLSYNLLENNKKIDSGFLLSTRDLCSLEYLPALIKAGVSCFKIEGRMKNPEYVAIVTRIYRKYIDLAMSNKEYKIDIQDKKDLLQAYNRGMSSSGHLDNAPNQNLVFKEKPNNMGLPVGKVQKYNKSKGYITLKLKEPLAIGDTISLEKETGTYSISELMEGNKNIKETKPGQIVTIGRMKGNISLGDKIYKISSKALNSLAYDSFQKENKKIGLNCTVNISLNKPISIEVTPSNDLQIYQDMNIKCKLDILPTISKNKPLEKEKVIEQIRKTASTPYEFKKISVNLDENIFLPKLSSLNELRRIALSKVEEFANSNIKRNSPESFKLPTITRLNNNLNTEKSKPQISLLLNILNPNFDYLKLKNIDKLYIPLKYFGNRNFKTTLKKLTENFSTYIYLPTIVKSNYRNLISSNISNFIKDYKISGFVLSNISNILLLNDLLKESKNNYEYIANYTFNIFNNFSINELKNLGICKFTVSPELDKNSIINLISNSSIQSEIIAYGKIPLMNMSYCLLGNSNKCYPTCDVKCNSQNSYYLQDRLGMNFRIIPDNIQTVTTVYNSKTTSILPSDFNCDSIRIDILDEYIENINEIIDTVRTGKRFEGKDFTNGNLNRAV